MNGTTKATPPTNAIAPFTPLPWQIAPLRDKSPVVVLTGSAGGGKSVCAAEKFNAFMLKYAGARGLAIRKAREYATKSIVPLMESVIGSASIGVYRKSELMFHYANGSRIVIGGVKDEQQREAIRSIFERGGVDFIWIEEANALTYEDFQELRVRMRGQAADWRQMLLTTNPGGQAHWIKQRLIDGGEAAVYYSSAVDNPHNPSDYLTTLNSLTGLQYDRLVRGLWKSAEGALWSYDTIERQRRAAPEDLKRIVIAVDPAVTNTEDSDETGIIAVGIDQGGYGYVLRDYSIKASPAGWARQAVRAYHDWQADRIVCETNNGGDMVEHTILTEDSRVSVKQVRASRGKHTRAEPIAALYEQGKVWHTAAFHDLEDQMTSWTPGSTSPDRMDALVWGLTELMLDGPGELTIGYAPEGFYNWRG